MRSKPSRANTRRIRGTARGLRTRFESAPLPGTITERPSGITPGGGGPGLPWRGWRTRLNEPGGSWPISSRVSIPTVSRARACASAWSTTPPPKDHEYGTTIPTFIRARLPTASEQKPQDRARKQELHLDRHPDAVTTSSAVKDLLPAHTQPRHEVLEVGHRRSRAAEHGRVERSPPRGEQCERGEATADLEAPVRDVLVRHAIACDVERRPEEQGQRSRAGDGSH